MNPRDRYAHSESLGGSVRRGSAQDPRPIYVSGEWEIDFARRELRTRGIAVPIGGRAFELIAVLVQSPGELVTKDDLMSRVWPGANVEENTLVVHISAIRKALGANRGMLKTVSGRGYRLLGTWTIRQESASPELDAPQRARAAEHPFQTNIPVAASALIGRESAVQALRDLLSAYRVVTLAGPGGIGKSVLALEVALRLFPTFQGDAWFVELVSLSDPGLVPSAVASILGLKLGGSEISPESVARAIGEKRVLLVLDNCEHVIDAAAAMAETLVRLCPHTTVLATSREVLRIAGEYLYYVSPLDVPSPHEAETVDVLEHSAVQLFIARTRSLRVDFSKHGENLAVIAAICRRLDGIPLAIEFAAARATTLGPKETLSRLDDQFALLTDGRRTALPKHRTLRATLDWSYELLSRPERRLLQRFAIFAGAFSMEAASAVTGSREVHAAEIADGIENLVAKSLVITDTSGAVAHFRLLETTRAYVFEKLKEAGEWPQFARLHAEYYRGLLERIENEQETRATQLACLGNVRAALEWCFGGNGTPEIGIRLAAAAAPFFLAMSLLTECHRWSERAIVALDDATRGGNAEMHLQAALGVALMFTHGGSDAARVALTRSFAIAEERGDAFDQLRVLGPLEMFHIRTGEFKTALHYAKRCSAVAGNLQDQVAITSAYSLMGISLHLSGELGSARTELEAALQHRSGSQRTTTIYLGFESTILAGAVLGSTLWLQGYPDQAMERARRTIEDAARMDHPLTLSLALIWGIYVFVWNGDLQGAEEHIDWLISRAGSASLAPYLAVGRGFKGQLAIRRGDATGGIASLQDCLTEFHATPYEVQTTPFNTSLAEGFAAIGRFSDGIALIEETIRRVEANGDYCYMPELLRVKGGLLLAMPQPQPDDAKMCFAQSLELSRQQGARALELRTAVDLAALLVAEGRSEGARALLQPVFKQFTEGFDTADLKAAERLLATLRGGV